MNAPPICCLMPKGRREVDTQLVSHYGEIFLPPANFPNDKVELLLGPFAPAPGEGIGTSRSWVLYDLPQVREQTRGGLSQSSCLDHIFSPVERAVLNRPPNLNVIKTHHLLQPFPLGYKKQLLQVCALTRVPRLTRVTSTLPSP